MEKKKTGKNSLKFRKGWIALAVALSMVCMTSSAFAWNVQDVDLSKINVTVGDPDQSDSKNTGTSENAPSSWAKEELSKASDAGILIQMTGNPKYSAAVSRLQFAELVTNMTEKALGKQLDAAPASTFSDTQNAAVRKAYQAGIVKGTSATTFAPNASITRQELAAMLDRAIDYIASQNSKDVSVSKSGSLSAFSDQNLVSAWASASMNAMVERKILAGTSATTLDPRGTTTVEQAILLVYRTYQYAK